MNRNGKFQALELDKLQATLYGLLEEFKHVVENDMPDKGLKCEDSQKVCLMIALREVEALVTGTTVEDLEEA